MITAYIIGFFATFVACAIYNHQCRIGEEISMPPAVFASLIWPITITAALLGMIWNVLEKIFNSISKK